MTERSSTFVLPDRPTPQQLETVQWFAGIWARLHPRHRTEHKWSDLVTCCRSVLSQANPQKAETQ